MKKTIALTLAAFSSAATLANAAFFADAVVEYTPGTGVGSYTNSSTALGEPSPIVGAADGFPNVFSPFSPHYETTDLVAIGTGGHLTLRLSHFVTIDRNPGVRELGIWENVGLIDSVGNGTATNPATTFGADSAVVEVSPDNVTWFALNNGSPILFNLPGNYYKNAGPYDASAPASPQFADFGKPFTGTLSSFDGENYSQVLATLNGSAGGTWLDLDSSPFSQVGYVRFSGVAANQTLEVDAVSINTSLAGAAVPEPASLGLLAMGFAACFGMKRHRNASVRG